MTDCCKTNAPKDHRAMREKLSKIINKNFIINLVDLASSS